jgi:hypothetical protein
MGFGIPWVTSDPSAYAHAEQKLREMRSVSGMAGAVGAEAANIRDRQDVADFENAEIAQLKARLGIQQDKAIQQSQHADRQGITETNLDTGVTTVSAPAPWQGESSPGSAQGNPMPGDASPSGKSDQSLTERRGLLDTIGQGIGGTPDLGTALDIGKRGLGALAGGVVGAGRAMGVLHDPARGARRMQIAELLGRSENRDRQIKALGSMGKLAGLLQPEAAGAMLNKAAPSYVPAGMTFKPPAAKNPTTASIAWAASGGDPNRAMDLLKGMHDHARQDPWFERTLEQAENGDPRAKRLISDWLYARHSSSQERAFTGAELKPAEGGIFETPEPEAPAEATPPPEPGLWDRLFGPSRGAASTDLPAPTGRAIVDESLGRTGTENPTPEKKPPLKSRTGRVLGY